MENWMGLFLISIVFDPLHDLEGLIVPWNKSIMDHLSAYFPPDLEH